MERPRGILIIIFLTVLASLLLLFIFYPRPLTSIRPVITQAKTFPAAKLISETEKTTVPLTASTSKATATPSLLVSVGKETLPILMYHYIESPSATTTLPGLYLSPAVFENQLQEITRKKYQTIFISEIGSDLTANKSWPPSTLALTFDDGYEDFYLSAWPLLKKYNLKGTLYIIINALDKPGYLTKTQLKEIAASGLVEIGSHTFNHPDLPTLKTRSVGFEIKNSRGVLENIIGVPVKTFAYPFGHYNLEDSAIASSSGYQCAVSTDPGVKQSARNLWGLKRLRPGNRQGSEFVNWLEDWFRATY